MEYVRIVRDSLSNRGELLPVETDLNKYIKNQAHPHYRSFHYYSEEQYHAFAAKGSIAGIHDLTTPYLVWDFDHQENIAQAQADTIELVRRLTMHGVEEDALRISFSGNKGFGVELLTDQRFEVEEARSIAKSFGRNLETMDTVIYNAGRLFRIAGTLNEKSKLYKTPLTLEKLKSATVDDIKAAATKPQRGRPFKPFVLPEKIAAERTYRAVTAPSRALPSMDPDSGVMDIDYREKPDGWTNCRWALARGFFERGRRQFALIRIAATCLARGYPKLAAEGFLRTAVDLQAARTGDDPTAEYKVTKALDQVYGDNWRGGQYTCKDDEVLTPLCASLGRYSCQHSDAPSSFLTIQDMTRMYRDYASRIDQNTILTGIAKLDEKVQLTVGMPVALLGAPSSGKTSLVLDILSNTSAAGIHSIFFEMDMYGPLVYVKFVSRITGLPMKEVNRISNEEPVRFAEYIAQIEKEFENVHFGVRSGMTVEEMRAQIKEHNATVPEEKRIRLAVCDYLECIQGPFPDANANITKIAADWKDMCVEEAICGVMLVQPPKSAGDARFPLTSMRQVKGASMLEQSFRVIFGIYREGFDPNHPDRDNFLTIVTLKNTMGQVFTLNNFWDGTKQRIRDIDAAGEAELGRLRDQIKREKAAAGGDNNMCGF